MGGRNPGNVRAEEKGARTGNEERRAVTHNRKKSATLRDPYINTYKFKRF
jgi:hypothetical protein